MSQPNPQSELKEYVAEQKQKWLSENSQNFGDVLEDEDGEYILVEPNLMDEGENESAEMIKVYLPDFTENL